MVENLKMRWAIVVTATLVGGLWMWPNLRPVAENSWLPTKKLTLGLDIQGGLHLVLGVDTESVVKEKTLRMVKNLEAEFKSEQIPISSLRIADDKTHTIEVGYASADEKKKINDYLDRVYSTVLQILSDTDQKFVLRYYDAYVSETRRQIISQAIEVIRNRIDEFGVAEPSIAAQGSDRILVQLPGIKDAARAKDLINRTARLDFRALSKELDQQKIDGLVAEAETAGKFKLGGEGGLTYQAYVKTLNEALKGKLPAGTRVVFEKLDNAVSLEAGRRAYLIKMDSNLSGDNLEDAFVGYDEYGKPQVNFRFNLEGRKLFAEITGANVGNQMAIVLDEVVKSAPNIQERIDSDQARITLGSSTDMQKTLDEAQLIATSLRAGALPAALEQLEERTVGPTLGAESIAKGQKGAAWGAGLVLAFMIFYYGIPGLVASVAILLNLLFTFSALTSLGATLTLPGVAGMALTVGMAVDANIIIFERMREELARGVNQMAAIRDGFGNAMSSILDSNITTILTCVVLVYFGTGPVRGFAVSLSIGIMVSFFTAVFVSRLMLETLVAKFGMTVMKPKKLVAA
jgi:preprotein translocase subunit SecD